MIIREKTMANEECSQLTATEIEALTFLKNIVVSETASHSEKIVAWNNLLGLTHSKEACCLIANNKIVETILSLMSGSDQTLAELSCSALVNLTAREEADVKLALFPNACMKKRVISSSRQHLIDDSSTLTELVILILCNLTRSPADAYLACEELRPLEDNLLVLMEKFCKSSSLPDWTKFDNIASLLSNLTQVPEVRRCFLNQKNGLIQNLLPFIGHPTSQTRRQGAVGVIRNCAFDVASHDWLLGEEVDITPKIFLPLAGGEEFDDEDNDKLPIELQYLDNTKQRELCPAIRRMLLETVLKLCATRRGRETLREKNIYVILRELHKWESDEEALVACENVVDIIIRTEDEIGTDNISEIEIPSDVIAKFEESAP